MLTAEVLTAGTSYYFSNEGNDINDGSFLHPLKSIPALNALHLNTGDSVLLKGGETFSGSVHLTIRQAAAQNFVLTSYGKGTATINAGDSNAIEFRQSAYIDINNINCNGSGRKNGNHKPGILINNCKNVTISNVDINGFQKAGLLIYDSHNINAGNINAHDNGFAGISISGDNKKDDCSNIHITNCSAVNNPGDPANFNNHSGNGIVAGFCKNVLIEYCTATNNGWDMPRIGNGPVGIWCYEADSVIIQHCISYQNKTSKGGEDGGGYDFDGGTTNSIIQYCLSYKNQGSAFGIFQYAGASAWHNNVIRFCISKNDGNISAAQANVYVWNSSHDSTQLKNLLFYNNTICNDSNAAISYSTESEHQGFKFYNNIFAGANEIIKGAYADDVFIANDWWSLRKSFNADENKDFKNWCITKNKEQLSDSVKGLNVVPLFRNPADTLVADVNKLTGFDSFKILDTSPVKQAGIDLHALFNINTGDKDFNNQLINKKCLGACTQ